MTVLRSRRIDEVSVLIRHTRVRSEKQERIWLKLRKESVQRVVNLSGKYR
jgi:hypothetical protein